ncbi:aromatic acid exporter family protein [Cellulomonas sp. 73-92]|uniref:FUSC family protein n=1 Tax=Cellulomonas sp. 73-92 TaxID=1895740 RepID=UPI000B14EBA1|nr:FUSC family protein [Cellulomonas sp. 73-92]
MTEPVPPAPPGAEPVPTASRGAEPVLTPPPGAEPAPTPPPGAGTGGLHHDASRLADDEVARRPLDRTHVAPAGAEEATALQVASAALRRLLLRTRLRQGLVRARVGLLPIGQAALAAGAAFAFAYYVLHHHQPFFAPIAAWACLGFTLQRNVRQVGELALAVGLGVGLGDLVVHWIGTGWWQVAVVLLVAALVARIVGPGAMLTMQAGTQAIVIVGLPVASGGPLGRWTDALVGGAFALLVAVLWPGDTRRRPRALGVHATTELAETLELVARGMRSKDVDGLASALVRGRAADPVLTEWRTSARNGVELARVSAARPWRDELMRLEQQAVLVERAMRTVRVLARRAPSVVDEDLTAVADLTDRFAAGIRLLTNAVGSGGDLSPARRQLTSVAAETDPRTVGAGSWHVQALVLLLRSPLVDALEAAGATPEEARAALPEL